MDVNDIDSRLKRVYASIGTILIQDHDQLVSFSEEIGSKPRSTAIATHFGPREDHEKWALIENAIAAIARLKDNLRNRMITVGHDAQLVEDEINKHLVLQLITDLDNAAKHGYPTRNSRSKKHPKIINLTSFIRVSGGSTAEQTAEQILADIQSGTVSSGALIRFDLKNNTQTYQAASNTKLVISAEVVDQDMNYMVELDDMIEDALLLWESFIVTYKLKALQP